MGALQQVRPGRAHGADGVARAVQAGRVSTSLDTSGLGVVASVSTGAVMPEFHWVVRANRGDIRVWQGLAGKREEFSFAEARALCIAGDGALLDGPDGHGRVTLRFDGGAVLFVQSVWLVAFMAALRGALKQVARGGRG